LQRLSVASRVVAAIAGGYAFANVVGIFLSRVLPLPRADAVLAMTLLSFALYAAAVIWTFAARSARLAWAGLLIPIALCGALAWLVGVSP
jgi:uncharacterized protein DUF3649